MLVAKKLNVHSKTKYNFTLKKQLTPNKISCMKGGINVYSCQTIHK